MAASLFTRGYAAIASSPLRIALIAGCATLGVQLVGPTFVRAQSTSSDEAPYAPRLHETSELIEFGTYEETPFALPWAVESVEEIPVHSRIDFKHEIDASYSEIKSYFVEAYRNQTPTVSLKASVSPTSSPLELKVYGYSTSEDGARFALGHSRLMRQFFLDLRQREGGVFLIFRNASYTYTFSGMVPTPSPFKPVRSNPVPLR